MASPDLLRLSVAGHSIVLEVSLWLLGIALIVVLIGRLFF
jgi:hypothetical protein